MATITSITFSNIKTIRDRMQDALNKVGSEYGIKIDLGKIRYMESSFTFKGEAKLTGGQTDSLAIAKLDWDRNCKYYWLKPEDFGKRFWVQGECYTLWSFKTGRSKYPIHAKRFDGKIFRFHSSTVTAALKQADAEGKVDPGFTTRT